MVPARSSEGWGCLVMRRSSPLPPGPSCPFAPSLQSQPFEKGFPTTLEEEEEPLLPRGTGESCPLPPVSPGLGSGRVGRLRFAGSHSVKIEPWKHDAEARETRERLLNGREGRGNLACDASGYSLSLMLEG